MKAEEALELTFQALVEHHGSTLMYDAIRNAAKERKRQVDFVTAARHVNFLLDDLRRNNYGVKIERSIEPYERVISRVFYDAIGGIIKDDPEAEYIISIDW